MWEDATAIFGVERSHCLGIHERNNFGNTFVWYESENANFKKRTTGLESHAYYVLYNTRCTLYHTPP